MSDSIVGFQKQGRPSVLPVKPAQPATNGNGAKAVGDSTKQRPSANTDSLLSGAHKEGASRPTFDKPKKQASNPLFSLADVVAKQETEAPRSTAAQRPASPREASKEKAPASSGLKRRVELTNEPEMTPKKKTNIVPRDPNELPVVAHRSEFRVKCASSKHAVVLVVGETGSGKTTKLPQYLLDDSRARRVCVTQPRRVAAITLARRVASERGIKLGSEVGYKVRFDDKTSRDTRLVFATDGLLLREAMQDPSLKAYDWIVLDEAHERSLNTDVLFGVVKRALKIRNTNGKIGLRVVVMSATIDVELFRNFFDASVMEVEGRQHPVEVWYLPQPMEDRVESSAQVALQIHDDNPLPGDVLIFLAGKEEIDACCRALEKTKQNIIVCPLHASLPSHVQMKAFEPAPPGYRKVVVSTNIAETSVTVDGVKFVIDSGVLKVKRRDKSTGIRKLAIAAVSKSQAWQRCGRAGREFPGKCYRMYTEEAFEQMRNDSEPEIKRVDLSEVVMQLLALGVEDVSQFDFLEKPDSKALIEALTELHDLGAIAKRGNRLELTEKGRKMSALPVDPMYANLLLKSMALGCLREIAGVVAMGGGIESPFYGQNEESLATRRKWLNTSGDHLTVLALLDAFEEEQSKGTHKTFARENFIREEVLTQAVQARHQLLDICREMEGGKGEAKTSESGSYVRDAKNVQRCLALGLSTHIAKRVSKSEYEPLFSKTTAKCFIHPSSVLATMNLRPDYVVFDEMLVTSKTYIRGVSAVADASWLAEDQPDKFKHEVPKDEQEAALREQRRLLKKSRSHAVD